MLRETDLMRAVRNFSAQGVIAVWLLTDLWRMWTPSLITLFGRAAETPAEVMGAFALGVMAAPLLLLAFVRRAAPALAAWLLVAAFAVRLALRLNPGGGDFQLYGSSLGVALAVAALCLVAGSVGRLLVPSVLLGVALSVSTHAALGTFGSVWRSDVFDVALLAVQALLVAGAVLTARVAPPEAASARTGLVLLPALLILQLALVNVGRGSALDTVWGSLAVVLGAWIAVAIALLPAPRRRPWLAAAILVAAALVTLPLEVARDGIEGGLSLWALAGFLAGPAALARLLSFSRARRRSPRRTALCAGAGAVVWTVFLFAFYAGYDLGYRADWAIVALAALVAAASLSQRAGADAPEEPVVETEEWRVEGLGSPFVALGAGAILSALAALLGPGLTIGSIVPAGAAAPTAASDRLTVAAYNLRMGYGMNGVFDPVGVAGQIRDSGAEVVLLSEVDRGWLLNGGQDQLAILARLLDMRFVFGPAGDQVWGDAVLTALPMGELRSEQMPRFDSLTGGGMTMATVDWNGRAVRVISTHLQPDADDDTLRQAEVFAQALREAAAEGPVIGGGDLNTEPGSAAWEALLASGAEDALAAIRPAPTWSADQPEKQIDHLFVSGLDVSSSEVVRSQLSDHLMIVTTVR